tara:strand:- start:22 stop:273 length:252 start_codon:yes stop_codon:yes gene_type:complete
MQKEEYTRWDADWDSWYGESIPLVFKLTIEQSVQDKEISIEDMEDALNWLKKTNARQPLIDVFQLFKNNFDENLRLEAEDNGL